MTGELPVGFRHDHYSALLGRGENTFRRAVEGLQTWQAHRLPFVRVVPTVPRFDQAPPSSSCWVQVAWRLQHLVASSRSSASLPGGASPTAAFPAILNRERKLSS